MPSCRQSGRAYSEPTSLKTRAAPGAPRQRPRQPAIEPLGPPSCDPAPGRLPPRRQPVLQLRSPGRSSRPSAPDRAGSRGRAAGPAPAASAPIRAGRAGAERRSAPRRGNRTPSRSSGGARPAPARPPPDRRAAAHRGRRRSHPRLLGVSWKWFDHPNEWAGLNPFAASSCAGPDLIRAYGGASQPARPWPVNKSLSLRKCFS